MQYFTADTHKITATGSYYDNCGRLCHDTFHLEDGRELIMAEEQTVNVTDVNGNGGRNPIRFVLKETSSVSITRRGL